MCLTIGLSRSTSNVHASSDCPASRWPNSIQDDSARVDQACFFFLPAISAFRLVQRCCCPCCRILLCRSPASPPLTPPRSRPSRPPLSTASCILVSSPLCISCVAITSFCFLFHASLKVFCEQAVERWSVPAGQPQGAQLQRERRASCRGTHDRRRGKSYTIAYVL